MYICIYLYVWKCGWFKTRTQNFNIRKRNKIIFSLYFRKCKHSWKYFFLGGKHLGYLKKYTLTFTNNTRAPRKPSWIFTYSRIDSLVSILFTTCANSTKNTNTKWCSHFNLTFLVRCVACVVCKYWPDGAPLKLLHRPGNDFSQSLAQKLTTHTYTFALFFSFQRQLKLL